MAVNDFRGFYTSRVFGTYPEEGMTMLAEGIAPAIVENVGRMAGMPMGPLEVSDSGRHRHDAQDRPRDGEGQRQVL